MDVRQVTNLIELLEFFADRGTPASLAEISRHFGWPRSSTFNILGTLVSRGYLYEPRAKEGYYPSPKWLPLFQRMDRAAPIPPEIQELLLALRSRTNETVVLAGISGMYAIFLSTAESQQAVRYTAAVGKVVPLHATATGRALLSQLSLPERSAILRRTEFERYTATTLMSVDAVEREIASSLQRGYFEGAGEYTSDLGGYALALQYMNRHLALLVGGPIARVAPIKDDIVRTMRDELARYVPAASATPKVLTAA